MAIESPEEDAHSKTGCFRQRDAVVERLQVRDADPHAGDVMNAYDLLVVPSRYESFGLVMAEGLWAGLPVISTPTGLARLVPGLTRAVPIGVGASAWHAAILDDWADAEGRAARVKRGLVFSHVRLGLSRFGEEWTDLLLEVGRSQGRTVLVNAAGGEGRPKVETRKGCGCGANRPRVSADRP